MSIYELSFLIPLLPGLAALITGLAGSRLKGAAHWPAVLAMAGSCAVSLAILYSLVTDPAHASHTVTLWTWIVAGNLDISFSFLLDPLSGVMISFISFVGLLVFIFATGYMKGDPGYPRFFAYLSLFAMMMFLLVLGDNYLVMFVGWEGVGLCSYLLIGYYMKEGWCASAGRKAFVVNRIGDFGFLVGLFIIFWVTGSLTYGDVFETGPRAFAYGGALITIAAICLFIGATGKSAQIPLMVWLPDAMAGPTPVSALIHAATMVTAGVYMVARSNVLFMLAPVAMDVVAVVGIATAFYAATSAIAQNDIKKVLAYSTVSQLGYMFVGLAVGNFAAGIFHVFTHAFFKGCLFLCAGSVIHALHHEQNMFRMGGLKKHMPITHAAYLIACLAIAGVPPFSGFFSKDEILWSAFHHGKTFVWGIGLLTAFLTAFYMFRSYFLTFAGDDSRIDHHAKEHLHESPRSMTTPLIFLAIGSLGAGFLNLPAIIGDGKFSFMHHFLEPVTGKGEQILAGRGIHPWTLVGGHDTELLLMGVSVAVALAGIALAWMMFKSGAFLRQEKKQSGLYQFSRNAWYWDRAYNNSFAAGCYELARLVLAFDKYIVDGIVNGAGRVARGCGQALRRLQNGQVQGYALVMLIGVNAILILTFYLIYTLK